MLDCNITLLACSLVIDLGSIIELVRWSLIKKDSLFKYANTPSGLLEGSIFNLDSSALIDALNSESAILIPISYLLLTLSINGLASLYTSPALFCAA